MTTPYVIAVDDDAEVLATLGRVLRREEYRVALVTSGVEALQLIRQDPPNLLILDIIMPGLDGIEVCKSVRQHLAMLHLPILFLTARGSTDDIIRGLDVGGDDYVVKPFELVELRARVRALLRHGTRLQTEGQHDEAADPVLTVGGLNLYPAQHRVEVNGASISLTVTEQRLLYYLMRHADETVPLTQLLEEVWEYAPGEGDPDLVRAHIRNLRLKVEKVPNKRLIRTVHGVGYVIYSE